MKKYVLLLFALLATGASHVTGQTVDYHFDKNANFYNYKTYKWVSLNSAQQLDELTAGQLVGTLELELAKKGLKKTQADDADLYIGYQLAPSNTKPLNDSNVGFTFGSGVGGNTGAATATVTTIHSGQLVLDMYDAASKKLIWRGVVHKAFDAEAKPGDKQKQMDKAVERLLKNYPPQKKS